MAARRISHARLKKLLRYDLKSGIFIWIAKSDSNHGSEITLGMRAGCLNGEGYWQIKIDGRAYLAHRLAWFYVTKRWPKRLDHENRDRSDNAWKNLREATHAENMANSYHRRLGKRMRNIWFDKNTKRKKRYRVQFGKSESFAYIGHFRTIEEAVDARDAAARRLYGEFSPF